MNNTTDELLIAELFTNGYYNDDVFKTIHDDSVLKPRTNAIMGAYAILRLPSNPSFHSFSKEKQTNLIAEAYIDAYHDQEIFDELATQKDQTAYNNAVNGAAAVLESELFRNLLLTSNLTEEKQFSLLISAAEYELERSGEIDSPTGYEFIAKRILSSGFFQPTLDYAVFHLNKIADVFFNTYPNGQAYNGYAVARLIREYSDEVVKNFMAGEPEIETRTAEIVEFISSRSQEGKAERTTNGIPSSVVTALYHSDLISKNHTKGGNDRG